MVCVGGCGGCCRVRVYQIGSTLFKNVMLSITLIMTEQRNIRLSLTTNQVSNKPWRNKARKVAGSGDHLCRIVRWRRWASALRFKAFVRG